MRTKKRTIPFIRLFLLHVILSLGLLGCQGGGTYQPLPTPHQSHVPRTTVQPQLQDSPQQLLQQAENSTGDERNFLLLRAADGFLQSNDFTNAETLLQTINYALLPPKLKGYFLNIHAELLLISRHYQQAQDVLSTDAMGILSFFDSLEPNLQLALLLQRARAFEALSQYLAATKARVFASSRLQDPQEIIRNNDLIWRNLNRIDASTLQSLELNMPDTELRGWVELASAIQQQQNSLAQQLKTVQNWQARWPGHIGQRYLPTALRALSQAVAQQPRKVALLLPSSGRLARATNALRDGFMAAYYSDLNQGQQTPQIIVIDTNNADTMEQIYAKVQKYGVDMIIGPLEKTRVQALAQMGDLPIPTLSLNYLPTDEAHPHQKNLFQFGIAAEDEVVQIAEQAALSGYTNAGVISPGTEWGDRVKQAFENTWFGLGGAVASSVQFAENDDYGAVVKQAMEIDLSQKRSRALQDALGRKVEFTPRRRQDIEFLVLLANPIQARQIKPALNFYFAADIPTFSTSNIYTGLPEPSKDKDLNGIIFTEMPWLFSQNVPPAGQVSSPSQMSLPRLFALGADAYALSARLRLLVSTPDATHRGLTGRLSLTPQGRVQREAVWIKFLGGTPRLLETNPLEPEAS